MNRTDTLEKMLEDLQAEWHEDLLREDWEWRAPASALCALRGDLEGVQQHARRMAEGLN